MKPTGFRTLGLCFFVLSMGLSSLCADIQKQGIERPKVKLPKSTQLPTIQLVPTVVVEVVRGEAVEIPISASPFRPGSTSVKILVPPRHGTLTRIDNDPGKPAVFRYQHDREFSDEEESFTFLLSDSLSNPSGTKQKARIVVRNPHAKLLFTPGGQLDFGTVPLGQSSSKTITLSNIFGSTVSGVLKASPPWYIDDSPDLDLQEGKSRTFTVRFSPTAAGEESSRLSFEPDPLGLPDLILKGGGQAPFVIISLSELALTKDAPKASLTVSNVTDLPLAIAWHGDSKGLQLSTPTTIPPHGTCEAWVSLGGGELVPDSVRKCLLMLSSSAFSQPVKVEVTGPKGGISLELLRSGEILSTQVGTTLRLEGIARNTSDSERTAELVFQNGDKTNSASTLLLPPKTPVNFHEEWTSLSPGMHEVCLEIREQGRVVDRCSWHISVGTSKNNQGQQSAPTIRKDISDIKPTNPVAQVADEATKRQLVCYAQPVPVDLVPGFFLNHVRLKWWYDGTDTPVFRIQSIRKRNAFVDRTGEQPAEEWTDVPGVRIQRDGVRQWSVTFPFLMPGSYTFRVFPDTAGKVYVQPITLEVTPQAAYWPPIRALMIVILIVLLLWVIRGRL